MPDAGRATSRRRGWVALAGGLAGLGTLRLVDGWLEDRADRQATNYAKSADERVIGLDLGATPEDHFRALIEAELVDDEAVAVTAGGEGLAYSKDFSTFRHPRCVRVEIVVEPRRVATSVEDRACSG